MSLQSSTLPDIQVHFQQGTRPSNLPYVHHQLSTLLPRATLWAVLCTTLIQFTQKNNSAFKAVSYYSQVIEEQMNYPSTAKFIPILVNKTVELFALICYFSLQFGTLPVQFIIFDSLHLCLMLPFCQAYCRFADCIQFLQ